MFETLGHYKILERIGAGGMGEVYRARDTRLGRTVAIKVLGAGVAADPDRRARFLQEARATAVALASEHRRRSTRSARTRISCFSSSSTCRATR